MIKYFRIVRRNEKLTEMAEKIGITYNYLSKIEHNKVNPSDEIKFKIINHLNLSQLEVKKIWPKSIKFLYPNNNKNKFSLNKLKIFFCHLFE